MGTVFHVLTTVMHTENLKMGTVMAMVLGNFRNQGTVTVMNTNFLKNRGVDVGKVTPSNRCPTNSVAWSHNFHFAKF